MRAFQIDAAIAVLAALILIVVSPGWAVDGLVAVAVLIGCGVSLLIEHRPRRRPGAAAKATARRRR